MQRFMLKSKIHRAKVTDCNLNYEGSISIAEELLAEAKIYEFERVDVLNINNGERFSTYAVASKKPGEICINGAAARLALPGDLVIIISYANLENSSLLNKWKPYIVKVNEWNEVTKK